ncbi:MAG: hypothetical protein MJ171_00150 [Clostridia bacterium]|nr:hypothetical protein [Clostridia bacterium]
MAETKETKTEQYEREIKERKEQEKENYEKKKAKVMGKGVPYIAAGLVWCGLALITPIYKPATIFFVTLAAWLVGFILVKIRESQIKLLPPPPVSKVYSDEIAQKLHMLNDLVIDRAKVVQNQEMKQALGSIAVTLSKMAEDVEEKPEDRMKVRKLANYYGDMLLELVDRFIDFENNKEAAPEGQTIQQAMDKILEAVKGADVSLKDLFDDLFTIDALEVNADINTLDKLMRLELEENSKKKREE